MQTKNINYNEKIYGKRVLVIDDDKSWVGELFVRGGAMQVDVVKTIKDAIDILKLHQWDAIVLDYELGHPTLKGDCLISHIRATQRSAIIYANSGGYNDELIKHGADVEFSIRDWVK